MTSQPIIIWRKRIALFLITFFTITAALLLSGWTISSITHTFYAAPTGKTYTNAILTRRCLTANYHWLTSERLQPYHEYNGTWSYGAINGCVAHYPIINLTTQTAKICVGASDSDPGTGNILYNHDNNRCYACIRTNGGTGNAVDCTQLYNIYGSVLDNSGRPVSGVTITASNGTSVVTDAIGNYGLQNLPVGTYTITPSKSGYTFSPASQSVSFSSYNVRGKNFTAYPSLHSITGIVTDEEGYGIAGVTIRTHTGLTTLTNNTGNYTFSGLPGGTYTLTPSRGSDVFSPTLSSISLPSASPVLNFTITGRMSISGTVTDQNNQPVGGVSILCNGINADKIAVTDNQGAYICNDLAPDMYLVEHPETIGQLSVLNQSASLLRPTVYGWFWLDSSRTNQDFTISLANGGFYGNIKDATTGAAVTNAKVVLGGASPVSSSSTGSYSINTLGGYYLFTISAPGYIPFKEKVNVTNHVNVRKDISLTPYPTNVYRLPFPAGNMQYCSQGNNSNFSHKIATFGRYAFDFGRSYNSNGVVSPIGQVVAVREGKVVQIKTNGKVTGNVPGCGNHANYVVIKHADGRASLYLHLKSVSVKVGDTIFTGQTIGVAGNTGCSTGTHLHFQLEQYVKGRYWTQSVPVQFYDVTANYRWDSNQRRYVQASTASGVPVSGYYYQSGNVYPSPFVMQGPEILNYILEEIDETPPEGDVVYQLTGSDRYQLLFSAFDYGSENLEMRLGRSVDLLNAADWMPFSGSMSWDYPMVYVQYRDEVGNASIPYSASVEAMGYEPADVSFSTNGTVCMNQDIGLKNLSTPYCEQCGWEWDFGDGQTSADMETAFDETGLGGFTGYQQPGVYPITLRMLTAVAQLETSQLVDVLPIPANGITLSRHMLTVTVSAEEMNAQDWIWDFGDGVTEHGRMASHTYATLDDIPQFITLRVVSSNGCESYNDVEVTPETYLYLPAIYR